MKTTPLKATYKHNGKMSGFVSLSTSPIVNPICKERQKDKNSICSHCYSVSMNKMYKPLKKMLINNYEILTSREITDEEIKNLNFVNYRFVRFEAFGDIATPLQMENYIKIAEHYKNTRFALWTKNPLIVLKGLQNRGYKKTKPQNLNIILSSPLLNTPIKNQFWFIDKVFIVYDKETIESKKININCGAKSCMNCLKCYTKNNIKIINEKLK